VGISARVAGS
jgi:hypothetical protein